MDDESLADDHFSRLLEEYDLAYKRREHHAFWTSCRSDLELKERVERAHEALRKLETAFDRRPNQDTPPTQNSSPIDALLNKPVQLDRFEIIRELGRGGFGIVYLANDPTLHRQVAIKIPRIEVLGSSTLQNRFAKEAEIAASLDHSHIVPVFEVGSTIDSIYIVSLYCPGPNLSQWLQTHPRDLNCSQIVELMLSLCDAMSYCHERGVLHRDIKPANVLLFPTTFGSLPFLPRLNDFGLAKVLESADSQTASIAMLGTPRYMAPEQASTEFEEICSATDVYGLGAILFELLAGHPPFRATTLAETLDQIRTEVPVFPKTNRSKLPHQRSNDTNPKSKQDDLETICLKCLAKKPSDRYPTARELLNDLQAFQSGHPISARRQTLFERVGRWTAKRSSVAGTLLLTGVVGVIASFFLVSSWPGSNSQAVQRRVSEVDPQSKHLQYVHDMRKAMSLKFLGNFDEARQILNTYTHGTDADELRDFAWHYLVERSNIRKQVFDGLTGKTLCADISPDRKWIVGGDRAGNVCIWNAQSAELVKSINYSQLEVCAVAFSPDGTVLATAGQDSNVHLWKSGTWEHVTTFTEVTGTNTGLAWSPDNKFLASCNRHKHISIWNIAAGKRLKMLAALNDVVRDVDWSADGKMLAANVGGSVVIWGTNDWSLKKEYPISEYTLHALAFSPDSRQLVCAGSARKLNLINCERLDDERQIDANGHVQSVNWSLDGRFLTAGLSSGGPRIWSTAGMNERMTFEKSDSTVRAAKFSSDNKRLLSAHEEDKRIILWDVESALGYEEIAMPSHQSAFQAHELGAVYATSNETTRVIDSTNNKTLLELDQPSRCLTLSANAKSLARETDTGIEIWDIAKKTRLAMCKKPKYEIDQMQFLVDTNRLIAFSFDSDWSLYELEHGTLVASGESNGNIRPPSNAFSLNKVSFQVASKLAGEFFSHQLRSIDDGRILAQFRASTSNDIVANATSTELYCATYEGISVIDLVNQSIDYNRFRTRRGITNLALSPDGRTLAVYVKNEGVYLWNVRTGEELFPILETEDHIDQMRFVSDRILQFRRIGHASANFVILRCGKQIDN